MVRKLLLLTCTIAAAATVGAASWSGAGTAANPYLVTSVADLEAINAGLTATNSYYGKYFKQTVDIDVTADSSTFAGIGQGNNTKIQFAGTYDGNGKAIHNLKIDGVVYDESGKAVLKTSNSVAGLFGFISANGTVKNLTIASDCSFKAFRIVGAVAGKSYGRIENCYNYAPVTAISNAAGGIVGQSADTTSRVLNCYNADASWWAITLWAASPAPARACSHIARTTAKWQPSMSTATRLSARNTVPAASWALRASIQP